PHPHRRAVPVALPAGNTAALRYGTAPRYGTALRYGTAVDFGSRQLARAQRRPRSFFTSLRLLGVTIAVGPALAVRTALAPGTAGLRGPRIRQRAPARARGRRHPGPAALRPGRPCGGGRRRGHPRPGRLPRRGRRAALWCAGFPASGVRRDHGDDDGVRAPGARRAARARPAGAAAV